jgi:hypothetical protein
LRDGERGPWLVLVGMATLIAAAAATINVRVNTFVLDETLLKSSAVHYTSGLPDSLFHDLSARGTARLYSLVLAPFFAIWDGDVAVRVARAFNAFLFASAAVPLYLLGRRVLVSRWRAVAAALLGAVAVPWLLLSSVIYTENLAWPLYLWTAVAFLWVLRAPSPARDAVALALIAAGVCTRVQFAALLPAYLALVLIAEWPGLRRGPGTATGRLQHAASRFPLLAAFTCVGVLALLALAVTGQLHGVVADSLGSYSEFQDRTQLPANTLLAALVEASSLSLGIGLLPAILGAAWYAAALRRGADDEHRQLALVTLVMGVALVLLVVYAQGGYLAELTEERYFAYLVPVLWIGAFAATEATRVTIAPGAILAGTLTLVGLFGAIPLSRGLDIDTVFLAPVQEAVAKVVPQREALGLAGFSQRDLLGYGTLVLGLLALLAWRRWPRGRERALLGAGVALQLAIGAYGWAVTDGKVAAVGSRTATPPRFEDLGWIDRHSGGERPVYVANLAGLQGPSALATQRQAIFFNDDLSAYATVPDLALPAPADPVTSLPVQAYGVDARTGRLDGPPLGLIVEHPNSPSWQLAGGAPIAASPDAQLLMRRVTPPLRATWTASGLTAEGHVPAGKALPIRLYPGAVRGRGAHVRMIVSPAPVQGPTAVKIRLAGQERDLALPISGVPLEAVFDVCLDGRAVGGEIAPVQSAPGINGGAALAGTVTLVEITPSTSDPCR